MTLITGHDGGHHDAKNPATNLHKSLEGSNDLICEPTDAHHGGVVVF